MKRSRRSKSQRSAPKPTGAGDTAAPVTSPTPAQAKASLADLVEDVRMRLEGSAKDITGQAGRLVDLMKFLKTLESLDLGAKPAVENPRYVT